MIGPQDRAMLRTMKEKIDEIERSAAELGTLGKDIPAIAKNVRAILASIYVLKCGISDVAELEPASTE